MRVLRHFLLAVCIVSLPWAQASEPIVFEDPKHEARFKALTSELRCLVCQNQTLADSDAPLAHDLRKEIHDMIVAGSTDAEIKDFMVARYGDFVLYRPPVQPNTIALWAAPLLLLLIGGAVAARAVRRRAAALKVNDNLAPEAEDKQGEGGP